MKAMNRDQLNIHTKSLEVEMEQIQQEINGLWDIIRKAQTAEENIACLEQRLFQIKSEHRKAMIQLVSGRVEAQDVDKKRV